jgi:long-chain acyl-CoA synthetase
MCRSFLHKDSPSELYGSEVFGCKTLWELLQRCMTNWGEKQFLGTRNAAVEGRPYEWSTFNQVYGNVIPLARGIEHLGLIKKDHVDGIDFKFLGIFGKNSENWHTLNLACLRTSITIVPFFESLGSAALAFVINQSLLTSMAIDGDQLPKLIALK